MRNSILIFLIGVAKEQTLPLFSKCTRLCPWSEAVFLAYLRTQSSLFEPHTEGRAKLQQQLTNEQFSTENVPLTTSSLSP